MSRLGFKSVVYDGGVCLGELDTVPVKDQNFQFPNNEIRIDHLSPVSERCPPLSVIQAISSFSVRCKLESSSPVEQLPLINLHASCFYELKVSIALIANIYVYIIHENMFHFVGVMIVFFWVLCTGVSVAQYHIQS